MAPTLDPSTVTLLAALVAAILLTAGLTHVPQRHRAVVRRRGRVVRVAGPGLALTVPLIEQAVLVPTGERALHGVIVRATTRDGVRVLLTVRARFRVVDPVSAQGTGRDVGELTADVVQHAVARHVARVLVRGLVTPLPDGLLREVNDRLRESGVVVHDVGLTDGVAPLPLGVGGSGRASLSPDRCPRRRLTSRPAAEHVAQHVQLVVPDRVPDVGPAALGGDQTGVSQHLQVVGDGGLGTVQGVDEVAGAHLPALGGEQQAEQPQPYRVAQGTERRRQPRRVGLAGDLGGQRLAAPAQVGNRTEDGAGTHVPSVRRILSYVDIDDS